MEEVKSAALTALVVSLPAIATVLTALLGVALKALTAKLNAQAKESTFSRMGARVTMLCDAILHDVEAEMRPKLAAAAADGVITDDERVALKRETLQRLTKALGEKGLAELQDVLKVEAGPLGGVLSGLVDSLLRGLEAKATTAMVTSVTSAAVSPTLPR